jgi:hypothetical protein
MLDHLGFTVSGYERTNACYGAYVLDPATMSRPSVTSLRSGRHGRLAAATIEWRRGLL